MIGANVQGGTYPRLALTQVAKFTIGRQKVHHKDHTDQVTNNLIQHSKLARQVHHKDHTDQVTNNLIQHSKLARQGIPGNIFIQTKGASF